MTLRKTIVGLGIVAFIGSWFLPVIHEVNGWKAFLVAFGGFWTPLEDWPHHLVMALTTLTNVVMIVAIGAFIRRGALQSRWAWGLIIAGVFDTYWLKPLLQEGADILIGFYLWWLSFFVVGLASLDSRSVSAGRATVASDRTP